MATNPDASPGLDLTACDREPIHIPGAVQPHGLLLVADAASLRVVAAAGDVEGRLAPDWHDRPLSDLLRQDIAALVRALPPGPGGTALGEPVRDHAVAIHRTDRYLLAELEPLGDARDAGRTLAWLDAVGGGFERATTLAALCERAAVAFRQLTGFDRVMIYRFRDDDAGVVVAEDRDPRLGSFLNHHFPASDIPRQARALYVRNRTRVIPDIDYAPAPLRPAGFDTLDLSDVAIRSVSPIHLQYLRNMGVGASASISIVSDGVLWGLVACHHDSPRTMSREVRGIAAALAGDLARQIRGKEAAVAYRERLALRAGEDGLHPLLFNGGTPADAVRARGAELRRMFDADGVALVQGGTVVGDGLVPSDETLMEFGHWLARRDEAPVFASRELGRDWPGAASFGSLAGVLAVRQGDAILLWLRAEEVEEVEWAGNPHKAAGHDPQEQLRPRASFESWRQLVRGRTRRWTLEQVEAARRLHRLLREARDAAELRRLNAELTQTVAEKDAALAQKDLLMREVDHRVQNSLQLVASFLSIQARDAGPGVVADQLVEARSRLSAVALVHRRLYHDDQIETVDLSRYLGELIEDLKASLGAGWARHMTVDLAPVLIPTDRAVNI
ncbi:histidine kinase dimerization/phosphoacceptor domain -containing protein, partial [Sphingomonas sp. Leaf412]|uniref:histidine kinase dimerization/phosphoacceptor domain -containing protein n=1 Tax=Sphingomonas sp. Leaf412 TaxID=1736370 RepID=UPI001F2D7B4C